MAPRLTVIISQSTGGQSRARDAEEALLAELLSAPGLDATLTASLNVIQPDQTDFLCLSSLTQSLALVSSLDYDQVVAEWERLQLGGQVLRVGSTPQGAERRVYYFSLETETAAIVLQLKQLLSDMSVQTVNVQLPIASNNRTTLPSSPTTAPNNSGLVALGQPLRTNAASGGAGEHSTTTTPGNSVNTEIAAVPQDASAPTSIPQDDSTIEWPDLEKLVDDFDALDW